MTALLIAVAALGGIAGVFGFAWVIVAFAEAATRHRPLEPGAPGDAWSRVVWFVRSPRRGLSERRIRVETTALRRDREPSQAKLSQAGR